MQKAYIIVRQQPRISGFAPGFSSGFLRVRTKLTYKHDGTNVENREGLKLAQMLLFAKIKKDHGKRLTEIHFRGSGVGAHPGSGVAGSGVAHKGRVNLAARVLNG